MLAVDDSALVRKLLAQVFAADADITVEFARNGAEALEKLKAFDPDVVTLDVHMPGMDGLACLDRIMLESPRPVVMVSSATAQGAETTLEALRLGAVDVVPKPSGALSLAIDEMAADLIAKVRAAAQARVSGSHRLSERLRLKTRATMTSRRERPASSQAVASPSRVPVKRGEGEGVVLVGVSTGGPPALEKLLEPLDAQLGWPIVIAQHMPATFTGALARRLNKICALTVVECTEEAPLKRGHVYIAKGDMDVVVSARGATWTVGPVPAKRTYLWRPSVDRLVRSAMEAVPASQLLGVMLTGMGSDGAAAMAEMRTAGGRTIAESEDSAVVWGMPGELVKMGGADWVAPMGAIADLVTRLTPTCR